MASSAYEKFTTLRDLDVQCDRIIDTKLMAYLLDPGKDEDHGYNLNALAHGYEDDYPVMTGDFVCVGLSRIYLPEPVSRCGANL